MKAIILSDIHLGRYKYGKMDLQQGIDTRTQDILNNIDQMIEYAIKNKADIIIITGDLYHIKRPDQVFRRLLTQKIEKMLANKFEVFIILGNHDQGRTKGHDLVELVELSSQILNLHVIEKEEIHYIQKYNALLCFFPYINRIEMDVKKEDFYEYQIEHIKKMQEKASVSNAKNKLFFAHFGTDRSELGNSVDLGQISIGKTIPLKIFDEKVWTKVYLGDIHKHQELNDFCRHMGSWCKVDFGEEGEVIGFYHYEDGNDKFVEIEDRPFITIEEDLSKDATKIDVLYQIIKMEPGLKNAITRLKLKIRAIDRKILDIDSLEKLLKEQSWNYVGKTLTEINDENSVEITVKEMAELNHADVFLKYIENKKSESEEDVYKIIVEEGKKALEQVLNIEEK